MESPLAKLLAAQSDNEAHAAFGEFGMKLAAGDVHPLLAALSHPNRMVRYHAVYLLGGRCKDKRVVKPLLEMLRDPNEDVDVRGTIADQLAHHRCRRIILPALIEASRDPEPSVRFWCVFALGTQVRRRRKPQLAAVRVLEARLDDTASVPGWWQVRLEAIAMLNRVKRSHMRSLFSETMRQVFANPLDHPEKWKWAESYSFQNVDEIESASRKLAEAGIDPVTFGDGINAPGPYSSD